MIGNKYVMGANCLFYKQVALLVTICIVLSATAHAQFKEPNRPDHDYLPYYFGIHLAYNNTYLHPSKSYKFIQDDSILSAEPGASGGVALGFLATFRYNTR